MRPPVVLLHGFTQTRRCWTPIDDALSAHRQVVALDAPGHGDAARVATDLWGAAEHFATQLDGAGPTEPATVVGYSMGGRMALHLALAHPELVGRLVLIGATAGIDDPVERAARRRSDHDLATRIERIGVSRFLDEWLALPLFAGLPAERAHRAERERNTATGLASSLRLAGTGTQAPLWDRLGELTVPTLVVTGARDERFTALGARLVAGLGDSAAPAVIADAGHSAHLEQPARFVDALERFLSETSG